MAAARSPNHRLRQARLRRPSPSGSGLPMSRAELATEANAWLWRTTGLVYALDANHVGKLERGESHWPRRHYRDAFRAVLHASNDAELGFHVVRSGRNSDLDRDVERADDGERWAFSPDSTVAVSGIPADADQRGRRQGPSRTVPLTVRPVGRHAFTDLAVSLARESSTGLREVDPMRRRAFLTGVGTAGLGAVVAPLTLESTRHGMHDTFTAERTRLSLDEWDEIAWEQGCRYMSTPPGELLDDLTVDMIGMQVAVNAEPDPDQVARLCRPGALLAVCCAMTLANLGDLRQARRWWRTAKHLADRCGDPSTIISVRGREIVRTLYERLPLPMVLDLIRQAEPIAATAPAAARHQYACGKAQALAMAGQASQARAALNEVHRIYDDLPPEVAGDQASVFGFPAERVRFAESYVYSYLGDYTSAEIAQDEAITTYPTANRRGPAQIELQRALCLTMAGDSGEGVRHAQRTLTALPATDLIRPIVDLGQRVLDAVPVSGHDQPTVIEYRDLLCQVAPSKDALV